MKYTYTLDTLPEVASKIVEQTPHKTLLFKADLGVGKTTLIKELAKARDFSYEFKQQDIPDIATVLQQLDVQTTPSDLGMVYDHADNAIAEKAAAEGKPKDDDIVYV